MAGKFFISAPIINYEEIAASPEAYYADAGEEVAAGHVIFAANVSRDLVIFNDNRIILRGSTPGGSLLPERIALLVFGMPLLKRTP